MDNNEEEKDKKVEESVQPTVPAEGGEEGGPSLFEYIDGLLKSDNEDFRLLGSSLVLSEKLTDAERTKFVDDFKQDFLLQSKPYAKQAFINFTDAVKMLDRNKDLFKDRVKKS